MKKLLSKLFFPKKASVPPCEIESDIEKLCKYMSEQIDELEELKMIGKERIKNLTETVEERTKYEKYP